MMSTSGPYWAMAFSLAVRASRARIRLSSMSAHSL
jgi:hypothetical protein